MTPSDLLSKKPLNQFTPEEYKRHVRSLFWKKPKRKAAKKKKLKPFLWRKSSKGTLILKFNRDWVSEDDLKQIAQESGTPYAEVWIKTFHPKSKKAKKPRLSTAADEERIEKNLADLPW